MSVLARSYFEATEIDFFFCYLKGMGDETLIGFLHVMPKTNPLLIKRIGTTLLDHARGAPTVFPVVKLAKVDSDTP